MSYTNVFGNNTLPPSEYGYRSLVLSGNLTLLWPYQTGETAESVAKIMDVSCDPGNTITLPDATQVSTGEDFLFRNLGANSLAVLDALGVQVAVVPVSQATYFYLTDNTAEGGVFKTIQFGAGSSFVDASSLVGYGIKAVGASLNAAYPVTTIGGATTINGTYRAKLIIASGGAYTVPLTSAVTLGNDFFCMLRNSGTGTITLDPADAQTIDGQGAMMVQPGESLMLFCSGAAWFSVGYGRSTLYQFTQLVKDVSTGGTFTLSATEASNKLLTFIGNPASPVDIEVPSIVSVYYINSELSTSQNITVKTDLGTGVTLPKGARIIALCDGTDVISAQSVQANTTVSLLDGSAVLPSLNFSSQPDTGIYKSGVSGLGISVEGVPVLSFTSTGAETDLPFNFLDFNTTPAAVATARLAWNDSDGTLNLGMKGGNVTQQVGLEQYYRVVNDSGVTINNGDLVMFTGTVGISGKLTGAKASGITASTTIYLMGVATESIIDGAEGFVTSFGLIRDIDTSGTPVGEVWSDGDILYYNPSVAGGLTKVEPSSPNAKALVATVVSASAVTGSLFIRMVFGGALGQFDGDVGFSGVAARDLIRRNAGNTAWVNIAGPSGDIVGTSDVQTLTNKTINLSNNTLVSTSAQMAAAVTDETGSGLLVFSESPAFSGTPTAPTAAAGTNTTQVSTTAHVFAERSNAATLTNKTLTSPTITNPTVTDPTITGDVTVSTNSANPALKVTQVGSGPALLIEDESSVDSTPFIVDASGRVGIGTNSPGVKLQVESTDAVKVAVGTSAQRPTGAAGLIRYNSETSSFEGYGTAWGALGGGATGGVGNPAFYENDTNITVDYTITSGKNAMSAGPITVNNGVTVTVPNGSVWSIV